MATRLLLLWLEWTLLFGICHGSIKCECTTEECRADGKSSCLAEHYCYSEYFKDALTRGCIDESSSLLCDNRKPKGIDFWPSLFCCKDKNFCNREVVPTFATDTEGNMESPVLDSADVNQHPQGSSCQDAFVRDSSTSQQADSSETARVINPIYIAVPVAGVCVLLALIIFAMYLLRRRNDQYDNYHHYHDHVSALAHAHKAASGNGGMPLYHQHHCDCVCKKNLPPCGGKVNRCTDSERSSSGSETKLFLQA